MFKEIFRIDTVAGLSQIALVIFMAVFVVTAIWIYTRSKSTVCHWSRLPLEDGTQDGSITPIDERKRLS